MFTFSLRESQDGCTVGAFCINMRFSISEFISTELKESAEFIIFTSTLLDITREHTEKDNEDKDHGEREIRKAHPQRSRIYKKRKDGKHDNLCGIDSKKHFIQRIRAVAAVHKPIHFIFKFTHLYLFLSGLLCFGTTVPNFYYSVLRASTGSFLEAFFAGIRPAIIVSPMLTATSTNAATRGSVALIFSNPVSP